MDNLEKFIVNHREEFDNREPADDLWQGIEKGLGKKQGKEPMIGRWIWKAASIILFAAVIGLLVERNMHINEPVRIAPAGERLTELDQVETYYSRMISQKRQEIQSYLRENPDFRKSFNKDINQLDSMYDGLKTELAHSYSDKIVDAMIVNLQVRIRILNQQLNILQAIEKTKENEKADI